MEIKYLKKMKKTSKVWDERNVPASEENINSLIEETGHQFPRAYLEFLHLGGENANMLADLNHGYAFNMVEENLERQQDAKEIIEAENFSLEKDFWVIADLDGCQQFVFFYFNDGDDPDNPPIYICDRGYWQDHEVEPNYEFVRLVDDSFSEYIEGRIKYRKRVGY